MTDFASPTRRGVNVGSLQKVHFPSLKGSQPDSANLTSPEKNNTSSNVSAWECSKEYEKVLKNIGKNRKLLLNAFEDLSSKQVVITPFKAREVIGGILENSGIQLSAEKWPYLLNFAEKNGAIDYKFLLDVCKDRLYLLTAHPKTSIVSSA